MSKGINKWIGIGNCCADPETRYTPQKSAITNITIACNDSYKDKNTGQMVDKTEFVRLVFFNRLAEISGEYLKKGAPVYIEGKLQTRKWKDNNGVEKYTTEVVVNEMKMLGGGDQASNQPRQKQHQSQQARKAPAMDDYSDDILF